MKFKWTMGAALLAGGAAAMAQDPQALYLRSLAATCAACHGTHGRAVAGPGVSALAGMDKDDLVRRLHAFKSGARPATVMQQISLGYSDAQIEQIAGYLARQKP
ncbi:c-type cytochrome [Rhodoferax sediminis]|uniref:C-type cytochrome n=1 Tax=Rhodoferax sediminis TaxID=2509614 RepID=A0A515D6V7_9BURK|nr:c-type cytochrome [Rhodoferax sediminis]QDL36118.1 c-type cytochrome [Rhodoferax sediminis]